jgi:hypothetical protein
MYWIWFRDGIHILLGNGIMKAKPFIDDMLYVVDGELMNHMLKVCKRFGKTNPEYQKVLNYMIKSIIQCTNYPTGEVKDELDDIEFEDMLWKLGIKLPNPNDPNNQYPDDEERSNEN